MSGYAFAAQQLSTCIISSIEQGIMLSPQHSLHASQGSGWHTQAMIRYLGDEHLYASRTAHLQECITLTLKNLPGNPQLRRHGAVIIHVLQPALLLRVY